MTSTRFLFAAAALLSTTAANAAMPITVSLETETPGTQDSTSGFNWVGVERFEGRSNGAGQTFTTDFDSSGLFSGTYRRAQILDNDQYGGAEGAGKYAVTFSNEGYSLDLTTTLPGGVTYFGFWLSALDGGNQVSFYQGQSRLFTFSASNALTFINSLPSSGSYFCNPNASYAGENCSEPYAFLNFYASGGTSFDRIVFKENPEIGGYESDNHTVGQWNRKSGTIFPVTDAVPEPQSWSLLMAGFGAIGFAMRRKGRAIAA